MKFLSAALIAAAMVATPVMARESHVSSRHFVKNANASTLPGTRFIGGGDDFRGNHFRSGFGGTPGDGYDCCDVWGHWGNYYGPMVPTL
jgi:hypothetical protein